MGKNSILNDSCYQHEQIIDNCSTATYVTPPGSQVQYPIISDQKTDKFETAMLEIQVTHRPYTGRFGLQPVPYENHPRFIIIKK